MAEIETIKTIEKPELTELKEPIALEFFKFFTGKTCTKCKNRFPSALGLLDNKSECPECGQAVN